MPYHIYPLRYAIDDWHQAANAKSNLDPTLKIKITDFSASDILAGIRLQVWHPQYGILFSCLPVVYGRLITEDDNAGLTTNQILAALRQLGFDIQFKEARTVNLATLSYLQSAMKSGYTHVRWAIKKHVPMTYRAVIAGNCDQPRCAGRSERIVICFNENKRPELLKQVIPPIVNFGGDIMQVSPDKNPNLDFSWLDVPVQIQSVLDNH